MNVQNVFGPSTNVDFRNKTDTFEGEIKFTLGKNDTLLYPPPEM